MGPATANLGYLRHPSIRGDQIVFVCDDDLWTVGLEGGRASRLTSGLGEASWPRFSPDGRQVAFVGREEGPLDVYLVPAGGGTARRLTFHARPLQVAGWAGDGSAALYASSLGSVDPFDYRLYEVDAAGGLPRQLPLGPAAAFSHGPDGAMVLARHRQRDGAFWKRYRGGGKGTIWVDRDGTGSFRKLLDVEGNLFAPCWVGDRVYFLSDHEGYGNVYSCTPDGEDLRRHTDHERFYARGLSADERRLVYHAGGDLWLLEPGAPQPRRLDVELVSSWTQRRRRHVDPGRHLDSSRPSPDGSRIAITTRGRAFTLPWEGGGTAQHGERQGIRYRLLNWLPQSGSLVAAASGVDDRDGERLVVLGPDGTTPDRTLDVDVGRAVLLEVAPVRDLVAVANHRNELLVLDLRGPEVSARTVDRSAHGPVRGLGWSPDGRWLAYGLHDTRETCGIKVVDVETGVTHAVTRPVLWDSQPAFDPDGRYLYFIGRHWRDAVYDEIHYDLDLPRACRPYAVCLRRDVPAPFDGPLTGEPAARVEIDFDGIEERVVPFPVAARRHLHVQGVHGGALVLSAPVWGTPLRGFRDRGNPPATLEHCDLASHRVETLAEGVLDFWVATDGRTAVCRTPQRLSVVRRGERPRDVDLGRVQLVIEPVAEWRQMLREAWRLQRENGWAEDLCGVDWDGAYQRYAPLVDRVATRSELSDLISELHGELGVSHVNEFDFEARHGPGPAQGLLGVDWAFDARAGEYVIERLVYGDPWDPEATSPLRKPGLDVIAGDQVLTVNGQRLDASTTPPELLVGQAGRDVLLTVRRPGGQARDVTVRALADELPGRYRDWSASRREAVHRVSAGRVGYLHVPHMFPPGYAAFHRDFLVDYDRDALIVDVRGNWGGHLSTVLLDKLARRRYAYGIVRWGSPEPFPPHSPAGPMVCLTNGHAGSDGDVFSLGFKLLRLGPLVGGRSWGGVTGISFMANHWLADGTVTTQPQVMYYFDELGWAENHGADVDIEVEDLPQDHARGIDPQLDRAVEVALQLLERCPPHRPRPAARPSRAASPLPPRQP